MENYKRNSDGEKEKQNKTKTFVFFFFRWFLGLTSGFALKDHSLRGLGHYYEVLGTKPG